MELTLVIPLEFITNTTGAAGGFWFIKIGDEVMKYNAISTNAVSGLQRAEEGTAAAHADGATVEFYQLYRVSSYRNK